MSIVIKYVYEYRQPKIFIFRARSEECEKLNAHSTKRK